MWTHHYKSLSHRSFSLIKLRYNQPKRCFRIPLMRSVMKTLTSSASKMIINKDGGFLSSKGIYLNKSESLFFPSKKLVNARFLQQKTVPLLQPTSAVSSSDAQAELEIGAQTLTAYESKTARVKLQLQKECLFGEQFFLVGDDPMLGLWDPTSAIPLEWSEEHIWNVELDIPVGKTMQFKLILRESSGEIVWQPGRDRILQTWETKNTITVFEDWEDAEEQKIIEEDPTVTSETLVAHNFTQTKEANVSNIDDNLLFVDSHMNLAKAPAKPMAIVAENIGCPKEDPVSTAISKMHGEKQIGQPDEKSAANKNMNTEEVLESNGSHAAIKNLAAENIGYFKEDTASKASNKILGEKKISQPKKKPVANLNMTIEEDVLKNNGSSAMINNLVAQNIGYPEENPVSEASEMFGKKHSSQPEEESLANKSMMTEDVLGNYGRATMFKNLASSDVKGNLITHEGDAVLVPGLTPLPTSDEGEIQDEDQKSIPIDASVGTNEAMNYNLPESDEKQDHEGDPEEKKIEIFNNEEQQLDGEQKQMPHLAKQSQEPVSKPLENTVMQNGIQWGRRTLQTFLTNLGLL